MPFLASAHSAIQSSWFFWAGSWVVWGWSPAPGNAQLPNNNQDLISKVTMTTEQCVLFTRQVYAIYHMQHHRSVKCAPFLIAALLCPRRPLRNFQPMHLQQCSVLVVCRWGFALAPASGACPVWRDQAGFRIVSSERRKRGVNSVRVKFPALNFAIQSSDRSEIEPFTLFNSSCEMQSTCII